MGFVQTNWDGTYTAVLDNGQTSGPMSQADAENWYNANSGGGGGGGGGWNSYPYGYIDQRLRESQLAQMAEQFMKDLEFRRWQEQFNQNVQRSNIFGNPRNLAQSLFMLGQSPEQVSATLNGMPMVQDLLNGGQFGINWQNNQAGNKANALVPQPGNPVATTQGGGTQGLIPQGQEGQRNPLFPFVAGRHIPAQQGMQWMESGAPQIGLLSGLASYSGQDPSSFWGEWRQFLPQGGRNPLSSFV